MSITKRRLSLLLTTAATGLALASSPCAAASDASESAATADKSQNQAEEIVVTAQKRSEALLSTPTPVTALTVDDLTRQGADKIADFAATVPGLNVLSSQSGQTVVIMRGISTGFGAGIPATTATYIDDVPYGSSTSAAYGSIATLDLDPATLKDIEVLRGPQGTLYGASSMGGLIKYSTRAPSVSNFRGRVELDGNAVDGGGQGYGFRGLLDGPLVEGKLGITVSGFDRLDPGYINDPHRSSKNVNGAKADGGRLALFWQPTDDFSAELSALIQDNYSNGTATTDVNADLTPIYGKYVHVRYGDENWDFRNRVYSLTANYDFGWSNLTSISSYAARKATWDIEESYKFGPSVSTKLGGIPNLGLYDDVTLNMYKTTEEVRLASPDGKEVEWLGGFYFTHEHSIKPEGFTQPISTITDLPIAGAYQPGGIYNDILHDSYTEYAGYADVTWHVTSNFKILGGLRYATNAERSVIPSYGLLNGGSSAVIGNSSDSSITYLASPSYNLDDNNMIYARIASGYRPGGPTNVGAGVIAAGAPTSYMPDKLTNYEAGYKANLPTQRMTIDLSGFYIDWQNIQLLTHVNGFNVTGNGGSATSDGFEFAWTWKPVNGLKLSLDGAYTDAHLTTSAPLIGGNDGDPLPDVPKFSGNLDAAYDFPLFGDTGGFVGGNVQYLGKRYVDFVVLPSTFPRTVMPDYETVNLRGGINHGNLTVEAFVKNVTDTFGITRVSSLIKNGYGAPLAAAIIPPRTFGLSISSTF